MPSTISLTALAPNEPIPFGDNPDTFDPPPPPNPATPPADHALEDR